MDTIRGADLLYPKKVTCRLCGQAFETYKVRESKLSIERVDSDFYRLYQPPLFNPLFYKTMCCPHCGFVFTPDFPPLKPAQQETLKQKVINQLQVKAMAPVRTAEDIAYLLKLLILEAQVIGVPSLFMAKCCLHLAWLYRTIENEEEEHRFLQNAVNFYSQVFYKDDREINKYQMMYLISELSFQVGNLEETKKWLNLLISDRQADPKYAKLGRDRWNEIKAQEKVANALS